MATSSPSARARLDDAVEYMTTEYFKIAGGTVYDPANGIDGEVRDIWIAGGTIVEPPGDPEVRPHASIDARGMVVMPGGVDMHCHIVGPKVNHGRKLYSRTQTRQPARPPHPLTHSGTMGSVPSTFATGYKYAGMGYTTAFDAAIPPLFARHAHQEFEDTPCIDKGFFALMGNNHYVMKSIQRGEHEKLRAFVGWLLGSAKGYAAKLVNPGGVELWKQRQAGNVQDLDYARRPLRDHAPPDHPVHGPGRGRAATAPLRPHPYQQPRSPRQLDDHARDDETAGRPSRPPHAHPVPQLRRGRPGGGIVLLEGRAARRLRQRTSEYHG